MIVGVHGIAQHRQGRRQLLQVWSPALSDGVEIAARHPVADVPLDLAFYGHLFRKKRDHDGAPPLMSGQDDDDLAALEEDEVEALLAAAQEVVSPGQVAVAEAAPAMGYTRVPRPLQAVARALDATFGAADGVLYLGTLRQVHRYLHDPELKAAVDEIVTAAVPAEGRILIGHSLGSVVALEFLRQHPEHRLDLFLTAGSPLGLHMVQAGLPVSSYGSTHRAGMPDGVRTWVNLRDPHDPVACAKPLSTWWSGIDERAVDNGSDAHKIFRYLSHQEAGSAILAADPDLGRHP